MLLGILALQGAVEPHEEKFKSLGATTRVVKRSKDLIGLSAIILPGGESSTMLHLLKLDGLWDDLKSFVENKPAWGLCAGAILLAKEVCSPSQDALGALDISVVRNAYGRQTESFISTLESTPHWLEKESLEGVFIRAPKINRVGVNVKTLFTFGGEPVMVQEKFTLASTFHPELSESNQLHRYFLKVCKEFA